MTQDIEEGRSDSENYNIEETVYQSMIINDFGKK